MYISAQTGPTIFIPDDSVNLLISLLQSLQEPNNILILLQSFLKSLSTGNVLNSVDPGGSPESTSLDNSIENQNTSFTNINLLSQNNSSNINSYTHQNTHTFTHSDTQSDNLESPSNIEKEDIDAPDSLPSEDLQADDLTIAHTLRNAYPLWIKHKLAITDCTSTIARYDCDWNRFYADDPIIDIPLTELSGIMDEWLNQVIKDYELTKKSFYNMQTIPKQIFKYAERILKWIKPEENIFVNGDIEINKKLFRKKKRPEAKTQVYSEEEIQLIYENLLTEYKKRPDYTARLELCLLFETGLRIGEVGALKFSDVEMIDGQYYLHVQRQHTRDYFRGEDGRMHVKGLTVKEHAKSDAGDRLICLTHEALTLIQLAKEANIRYDRNLEDYIFLSENGRYSTNSIVHLLDRTVKNLNLQMKELNPMPYSESTSIRMAYRSPHKIRKTVLSKLIEGSVPIAEVSRFAGHSNPQVTWTSYAYNTVPQKQVNEKISDILSVEKAVKKD